MTTATDDHEEFTVLHGLKVRGLAGAAQVAESTGLSAEPVQRVLDEATESGAVRHRATGRAQGYMLTAEGRERHRQLRDTLVTDEQRATLEPAYQSFLEPNRQLKEATTVWQTEADGDTSTVLPQLEQVHTAVSGLLADASSALPRLACYQSRFDGALARFRSGDGSARARPMSESYHDVWMELHEDLLVTLGRERGEADGH